MRKSLEAIRLWAALAPEQPAIVLHDRLITYRMLASGILAVEARLEGLRLDRDRPIGVCIESPARHLIVTLALAKAGFATISLTSGACRNAASFGVASLLADAQYPAAGLIPILVRDDWFTSAPKTVEWRAFEPEPGRIVRLSLTSGSTGTAKAIAFTDEAITGRINDARGMIESGQPRTLVMFDPASNVGFTAAMNILNQGRTVLFARSIEDGLNIVRSSSVTCIIASTRHMDDLVSLSAQTSGGVGVLPSVQRVIMGGSYMPASLLERIRTVFRCEIYQVYASTEAGAAGVNNISMMTAPDASTNRYIPCEQVRIVPIDGEDGETGAIEIHSSHMGRPFEGSLSMPVAAQPEWFRPGDLGYMDAEGLLVVVGRMDDLINMGGLKRPAEFFEGLLAQCPLVRDCAVIRVDAGGGPRIVVLVQYAGAPDDVGLEAWALKHPLRLAFDDLIPVASIARTEMGKIERARAREMAMQAMAKPTRH